MQERSTADVIKTLVFRTFISKIVVCCSRQVRRREKTVVSIHRQETSKSIRSNGEKTEK